MLVGVLAGVLAFAFAWLFGEPQVDLAIAFETHMHQLAHDPPEAELVSRAVQSTLGLFTATLAYGVALGGIFAVAFAFAHGRMGKLSARATALILASAGLLVLIIGPQLKYPANPPAVGNPDTIGARTALYFEMIVLSVIAAIGGLFARHRLVHRLGVWNASLAGVAVYIGVMTAAMLGLPPVDEVPSSFAATTLWKFRLASLGINTVVWMTIGLAFGALTERRQNAGAWRGGRGHFAGQRG
jgi:hypothetical protein